MKKEDVPQDQSYLSKIQLDEINYAVNSDGSYIKVKSQGWEAKNNALDESLELLKKRLKTTTEGVKSGKLSPIAYYMELHRMDIGILASYVGYWRYKVKRHLSQKRFEKLSTKVLRKYAEVFSVTIDNLKNPNFDD